MREVATAIDASTRGLVTRYFGAIAAFLCAPLRPLRCVPFRHMAFT